MTKSDNLQMIEFADLILLVKFDNIRKVIVGLLITKIS